MGAYGVCVNGGPHDGARVTSAFVPWVGTLEEAEALADEMREQAKRYGHIGQDYDIVEVER